MSTVEKERDYFSRMQQGDKCAFEYFFKTYVDMLYAYAMGFCRDQDVAEDLVQEAFVRFWTMREKLSYSESIYGYLQRTVRNICINQKVRERVEENIGRRFYIPTRMNSVGKTTMNWKNCGGSCWKRLTDCRRNVGKCLFLVAWKG